MTTPPVPRIRPRKDKREIKWHITFYLDQPPQVRTKEGYPFTPYKVEVLNWPRMGRAYVKVTGPASHRYQGFPSTANFGIKGCPDYQELPEWLKALVKEAMGNP